MSLEKICNQNDLAQKWKQIKSAEGKAKSAFNDIQRLVSEAETMPGYSEIVPDHEDKKLKDMKAKAEKYLAE